MPFCEWNFRSSSHCFPWRIDLVNVSPKNSFFSYGSEEWKLPFTACSGTLKDSTETFWTAYCSSTVYLHIKFVIWVVFVLNFEKKQARFSRTMHQPITALRIQYSGDERLHAVQNTHSTHFNKFKNSSTNILNIMLCSIQNIKTSTVV